MSLFAELKRRNVFRVTIAYVLLGWAVLQGADFLLDLVGAPEWVIRVFVIAGLVGLPFAIFFAWAYEMTPEGIKREADIDRSQSITPHTGKKLDRAIIGLLLLVIALMALERFFFAGGDAPGEEALVAEAPKTIAALPFADLSQAQDQGWFADGLAEEILNALVKVPDLQVASRTASFAYRDSSQPMAEIAAELGVAHVLEGSVRSSGDRIRVTAQLIRAGDGFHVWSQNYDRDVADMIGIQEDLARSIATALETSMDPEALAQMTQVGTSSVEAYQEYLRGLQVRAEANTYNSEQRRELMWKSYEHFEAARSIDPAFGSAHAEAAAFWKSQLTPNFLEFGITDLEPREMLREYNLRIGQAIDNAGSEVDEIRGLANRAMMDLRLREARRLFEQYIALRPNDREARESLIDVLLMLGERDAVGAVLDYYRERLLVDANSAIGFVEEIWRAGEATSDVPDILAAARRWTSSEQVAYQAHRALLWAGRNAEAAEMFARFETLVPQGNAVMRARQACVNGDRDEAEKLLADLDPEISTYAVQSWLIGNYLGLEGEEIAGFQRLASTGVPFMLASFLFYPQFDPRPYPELMAVLEREGIKRPQPVKPPFACPPPSQPSVAVLPFIPLTSGPDDGYFADGLTEEILNSLAQLPELLVTARTSSFQFREQDANVQEIARRLGVAHIVEGSVRRAGERLRVTAQLVRATDGFHLWSNNYDALSDDTIAVQEDIAEQIALALDVVLDDERRALMQRAGLRDVEAFIAFQRAREIDMRAHREAGSTEDMLALAIPYLDQVLERVPGYPPALKIRADHAAHLMWENASSLDEPGLSGPEWNAAQADFQRDLEAAMRHARTEEERANIAYDLAYITGDWRGMRKRIEEALSQTGCDVSDWLETLANGFGYARGLVARLEADVNCDPLIEYRWSALVHASAVAGDIQGALDAARRARGALGTDRTQNARVFAHLRAGELESAWQAAESRTGESSNVFGEKVMIEAMRGDAEAAAEWFEDFRQTESAAGHRILPMLAWLGRRDEANELAAELDGRPQGPVVLSTAIELCGCGAPWDLGATPRFAEKLSQAGLDWPPVEVLDFPLKDW